MTYFDLTNNKDMKSLLHETKQFTYKGSEKRAEETKRRLEKRYGADFAAKFRASIKTA